MKVTTTRVKAKAKTTATPEKVKIRVEREYEVMSFGSVTVRVARPSASDIEKNILSGQSALVRAKGTLAKPGVKIIRSEGKPIYFASPDQPDVFIREMNGVRTYGKLSAGRFLPLPIQTPNPQQKKRTTARAKTTSKVLVHG